MIKFKSLTCRLGIYPYFTVFNLLIMSTHNKFKNNKYLIKIILDDLK